MSAAEDVAVVVQDYFDLLKSVYHRGKPNVVELDEDPDLAIVDGVTYDFSDIPHDDQENTGRRMEIEVLFCEELPLEEIQRQLNEKIQKEW
ncbi:MAG: hypothetical protein ACOX7A_01525 [Lawsonibacter sp.]|jgi:hypothetical protein